MKISVILPSYNEKDNIVEAIQRIEKTISHYSYEIIVVDDYSPDKTWEVVQNIYNKNVKLIIRKNKKGLASALRDGIDKSSGDIIIWLDCDLGIPPEEIANLLKFKEKYDVVIGSRFVDGGYDLRSKWISLCSKLINYISYILISRKIKDYTSGFIMINREVKEKTTINTKGFGEYFIEFMFDCLKKDFKIKEVGYVYGNRKSGVSKSTGNLFVFFKLGLRYLNKIFYLAFIKKYFVNEKYY